jgi:hypothetical protein
LNVGGGGPKRVAPALVPLNALARKDGVIRTSDTCHCCATTRSTFDIAMMRPLSSHRPTSDVDSDASDSEQRRERPMPLRPGLVLGPRLYSTHRFAQRVLDSFLSWEIYDEEGVLLPRIMRLAAILRLIAGEREYHLCPGGCPLCQA